MRTAEERPRVRPTVWLLVLLTISFGLLYVGATRAWFVGALGSETYGELKFALSWATLGLACGLLATFAWARLTHGVRKSWLTPLLVCALMVAGSQYAARDASERLVLVIDGIRWDPEAGVFLLHAMAAPGVAHAYQRGELEVTALVESRSRGPSGVPWKSLVRFARPGQALVQHVLHDLREETATPPSAHLDGVALVELGYIRASGSLERDRRVGLLLLCHRGVWSGFTQYLPVTAKVTLVNRAQQPVGRTAGAAFLLPWRVVSELPLRERRRPLSH